MPTHHILTRGRGLTALGTFPLSVRTEDQEVLLRVAVVVGQSSPISPGVGALQQEVVASNPGEVLGEVGGWWYWLYLMSRHWRKRI